MKNKVAIGFFILFFALSGDILLPGKTGVVSRMWQDAVPAESSQGYSADLELDTETGSNPFFPATIKIATVFFLCLLFLLPISYYAVRMLVCLGRTTRLPTRAASG